ncbi:hypothetical protein FNF31_05936 [Cafeteria roenbergensis]|uniref:BTB domain-containing protein n=1 Tax=Cafeteria roenbergensis TaxID=33653 RepID=A0A5A8CSX0_CAFRO|nr:hypothetical protein FNF31_05936 [Cafeteria roenbergensis]
MCREEGGPVMLVHGGMGNRFFFSDIGVMSVQLTGSHGGSHGYSGVTARWHPSSCRGALLPHQFGHRATAIGRRSVAFLAGATTTGNSVAVTLGSLQRVTTVADALVHEVGALAHPRLHYLLTLSSVSVMPSLTCPPAMRAGLVTVPSATRSPGVDAQLIVFGGQNWAPSEPRPPSAGGDDDGVDDGGAIEGGGGGGGTAEAVAAGQAFGEDDGGFAALDANRATETRSDANIHRFSIKTAPQSERLFAEQMASVVVGPLLDVQSGPRLLPASLTEHRSLATAWPADVRLAGHHPNITGAPHAAPAAKPSLSQLMSQAAARGPRAELELFRACIAALQRWTTSPAAAAAARVRGADTALVPLMTRLLSEAIGGLGLEALRTAVGIDGALQQLAGMFPGGADFVESPQFADDVREVLEQSGAGRAGAGRAGDGRAGAENGVDDDSNNENNDDDDEDEDDSDDDDAGSVSGGELDDLADWSDDDADADADDSTAVAAAPSLPPQTLGRSRNYSHWARSAVAGLMALPEKWLCRMPATIGRWSLDNARMLVGNPVSRKWQGAVALASLDGLWALPVGPPLDGNRRAARAAAGVVVQRLRALVRAYQARDAAAPLAVAAADPAGAARDSDMPEMEGLAAGMWDVPLTWHGDETGDAPRSVTVPPSSLATDLSALLLAEQDEGCGPVPADLFRRRTADVWLESLVDGTRVAAHRFVLATRSARFRRVLTSSMREAHSDVISIPDVDGETLRRLVEFLYTDGIASTTGPQQAMDLLVASNAGSEDRLSRLCEACIAGFLDVDNATALFEFADHHSCTDLRAAALSHIIAHFKTVAELPEFENLAEPLREEILRVWRSVRHAFAAEAAAAAAATH